MFRVISMIIKLVIHAIKVYNKSLRHMNKFILTLFLINVAFGRVFPYTGYGTGWTDGIQFLMKSRNITIGFIGGTQPSRWNNSLSLSDPKFSFFVVRGFRGSFLTGNLALSYSKILKNKKLDEEFLSVQNIFRILNFADFHQSVQFDLNDVQNGSKIRKLKLRNLFTSIVFTTTTWLRLGIDFNEYRSAYLFETMKDFPDTLFDKRLRKDIRGIDEGKINVVFKSNVKEIKDKSVILTTPEGEIELPNDYVFIFIGGTLPYEFLKKVGINIVQKSGN
jgi:hypothetical protein